MSNSVSITAVEAILAPYRTAGITMLGTREVKQILQRKDDASTIRIMRELMGAIKDGNEWKVSIEWAKDYLLRRYHPSLQDRARAMLTDRPRKPHRKSKRRHGSTAIKTG